MTTLPLTAVTGATGQLGRLVLTELLARGAEPASLVAVVRSPQKAADLAALGIDVRQGDYDQPATLATALAGVTQLLLVSSSEVGKRLPQHSTVLTAAVAAGVERIVYTSILKADTTSLLLAQEHLATEQLISASGLRYAFLRNGWYAENYTGQLAVQLQYGAVLGATQGHPLDLATRQDFAAAAAVVLLDGTDGVYELAGVPTTLTAYAAELSAQSGQPVAATELSQADYEAALAGAGVPAEMAAILADADRGVAEGELSDDSGTLEKLIGRPATPVATAIAAALAASS